MFLDSTTRPHSVQCLAAEIETDDTAIVEAMAAIRDEFEDLSHQ